MRWMLAVAAIIGMGLLIGLELIDILENALASIAAIDLTPMPLPMTFI